MPAMYEVHTTLGSFKDAETIARKLVGEQLAACVQIVPGITSVYHWEEMLRHDEEVLLLIKTSAEAWPLLRDRLAEVHPYDTPEIIAVPVEHASYDYLAWVKENTKS